MQNPIKYFFPKTIATYESDFNNSIEITSLLGKQSIQVDNLSQSSQLVEDIWKKGIRHLKDIMPGKILILGLAGGSMLKPITKNWPKSKITAIEIDPIMIKIGKKHFNIDRYKNLSIKNQDARKFVKNHTSKFDLILVDLYTGRSIPKFVSTKSFIENLKIITNPEGINVFNRLTLKDQKTKAEELKKTLTNYYKKITKIKTPANWLLACQD